MTEIINSLLEINIYMCFTYAIRTRCVARFEFWFGMPFEVILEAWENFSDSFKAELLVKVAIEHICRGFEVFYLVTSSYGTCY